MCSRSSSPLIKGNVINENQGRSRGGGIWCHDSAPIITSNTISRNSVGACGGGIYLLSCSPPITNNVMTGNTALRGAGIYCQSSSSVMINNMITLGEAYAGGGVYCKISSAKLINNTIALNNGAYWGGGICCHGSSSVTLANNVVAFNSSGVWVQGGAPTLSCNCVFGNTEYDYSGLPDPTGTGGNISADPKFASMEYGDMHIQPDSPCVNAGDNSMVGLGWPDMEGQPRVQNGRVDIGADESDGTERPQGPFIIVRVSPDGNDANDGSSWALAKRTVQAGIDDACAAGGEVWVRAGVYNEWITLHPYAYLYGGFAGIETAREQRDWASNVTVLEGRQGNHVVSVRAGRMWSAVDGFTIRNGESGIYCRSSSLTIAHNVITGNSRAGVWCCEDVSSNISNNVIVANGAYLCGAIRCYYSSPTIINNLIAGNGGGIQCEFSSPTLCNNIVAFNASGISNSQGTPDLRNNCVYGNTEYNYSGVDDPTGTLGNISTDPGLASMEYGNMHIRFDSPCVDAGDGSMVDPDSRDIDGQPRVQGAHVDIGADESDGTAWPQGPYIVVRVNPEGDDANDGSSWAFAKRTVQAGIDAASAQGGEVWVKAGVYDERITLPAYVYLYGGFDATETAREERAPALSVTVLDGGQGGSVVTAQRCGHLLSAVDGFTIRNGSAYRGGGICCSYSSPTLTNNTITGNSASHGGGLYCYYCSSPTITNNSIRGNSASTKGGGIYCCDSSPMMTNNTITGNSGRYGGGIYCSDSAPAITNNTITGNSASTDGGGMYCYGASSYPALVNNIVAFNSSGIYNDEGTPSLRNNCMYGNTEYDYSGIPDPTGVDGNISMDPVFVDLPGGDYHLAAGSPCIDAGDDSAVDPAWLDMDGEGRIYGACVDIGADELWPIFVWIDVKPGTHPNTINLGSRALIPVAVLTTEDFDATTVNPATVEFAGSGIAVRGRWGKPLFAHGDVDGDGDVDLLMHFDTQSLLLDPGTTEATLTGETFNGRMIEGSDSIVVVARK